MPDQSVNRAPRRVRWRWAIGAVLVIALPIVLLGALLVWQPAAVLRAGLWLAGRDDLTFDQLELGLNEIELTGLRIGGAADQRVGRVHVAYRPGDLLRGRIERVSVEGVTLRGRLDRNGLQLEGLDLTGGAADEPTGLPTLPLPERVSVRDVRLELATPLGDLIVPVEAEVRPEQDRAAFVVEAVAAELAGPSGRLRADLRAEGEMPLGVPEPAMATTASGRLQLRADDLSVPEVASGIDGSGDLAFVLERGALDATLADVRLQFDTLAPAWDAVAELLPPPWQLELARSVGISTSLRGDEILLQGSGEFALATAGPQVEAVLSASATLDAERRLRELVVPDTEVVLHQLLRDELRLERATLRGEGAGTPEAWEGSLDLDLAGAGAPWPGLTLEGVTARAALNVQVADGRLRVTAREPGVVQLAGLGWADDVRAEGLEIRVHPDATPLLSAGVADGAIAWEHHLSASVPAFAAEVGQTPWRLTGNAEELQLELAGDAGGVAGGRVALGGGAVHVPAYHLRLSGIAAEAHLSGARLDPERSVPVSIAAVAHGGTPAWFGPLRLEGSVQPRDGQIAFDATATQAGGAVELRVQGQHDPAGGTGRARLHLPPIELAPARLQVGQLSPWLGDFVRDASGQLALDGSVAWGAGERPRADLELLVQGLGFGAGPARFEQVNGVIALDRLVPPSTPPGQQLAVGLVDVGLPLINGLVTFDLEPGELLVEQLRWQFAEGRIRATPFTVGSAQMGFSTTLEAERLQLDEIFALAQLEGLSGEGTVHGTLPITVSGAEAVIEGGELVSDGPGWVRYRPDQAPAALQAGGENVNLLLQALENFRYEQLRLTIDGRTDGEMDVGLHIAGANPDLLGGHPIEFNLNLEGALAAILRASLASYQIPEAIRRQMQGFGR